MVMCTTKLSVDRRALATRAMRAAIDTRAKAKLDQGPGIVLAASTRRPERGWTGTSTSKSS